MTVYVDDAMIVATISRLTSCWSHLIADDQDELHDFADRLGVRTAWLQDPARTSQPRARPGSRAADNWHYDLTAGSAPGPSDSAPSPSPGGHMVTIINHRYDESLR